MCMENNNKYISFNKFLFFCWCLIIAFNSMNFYFTPTLHKKYDVLIKYTGFVSSNKISCLIRMRQELINKWGHNIFFLTMRGFLFVS